MLRVSVDVGGPIFNGRGATRERIMTTDFSIFCWGVPGVRKIVKEDNLRVTFGRVYGAGMP